MNVVITKEETIEDGKVKRFTVRIDPADKKELIDQTLKSLANDVNETFKDGDDIRAGLEKKYGPQSVAMGITSYVAAIAAAEVVNERDLEIMFTPQPVDRNASEGDIYGDGPWEMAIDLTMRPRFELSSYDPVVLERSEIPEVTEEMIASTIDRNLENLASVVPVDGALMEGDFVVVDMETHMNGELAQGLTGKDMHIVLLPDIMPVEFIEGVTGMKVEETRDFSFASPEGDPESDVPDVFQVHVTCKGRYNRVVPELTPELIHARFAGMGNDIPEFKDAVKKKLEENLVLKQRQEYEVRVDDELAQRLVGTVDDYYVQQARHDISNNIQHELMSQGMSLEEFLEQQGSNEEQYSQMVTIQAMESLKRGFALDAVWRHMGVELQPEDYERAIGEMSPGRETEVKQNFEQNKAWFVVRELAQRLRAHDEAMHTMQFK